MLQSSAMAVSFRRSSISTDSSRDESVTDIVGRVLAASDSELDYARAKLTFDRVVDPSIDVDAVLAELDGMTDHLRRLAAGALTPDAKLGALRKFLHEPGPWNDHRAFAYDQSDPLGRKMQNKLLHNYVKSRLGQCVSMPALFLILAERQGLDVSLALAPDHVFVRVKLNWRTINLETTSGAHPARDAWYRQGFPITDRSIETGLYLRSLSMREGVAVLASIVVEHLFEQSRFNEAIAVCNLILTHCPNNIHARVCLGSAYGHLLERFQQEYPNLWAIPPETRAYGVMLMRQNKAIFDAVDNLGWVPFEEGGYNVL